jgi:uncharacterized membrane protein
MKIVLLVLVGLIVYVIVSTIYTNYLFYKQKKTLLACMDELDKARKTIWHNYLETVTYIDRGELP